jgi:hypothetical protein
MSKYPRTTIGNVMVGPEQALAILENCNTGNRPLHSSIVKKYTTAMRSEKWMDAGESLKFDWNGVLLNGQHRLGAIVLSGIPQVFTLERGLDPATFEVIDSHSKRSILDLLYITGNPHGQNAAMVLRMLLGRPKAEKEGVSFENGMDATNGAILAEARKLNNDLFRDALLAAKRIAQSTRIMIAPLAAWYYETAALNGQAIVDEWIDGLCSGVNLEEGDPRLAFRQWTLSFVGETAVIRRSRTAQVIAYQAIQRAWIAECTNSKLKNIRVWKLKQPGLPWVRIQRHPKSH